MSYVSCTVDPQVYIVGGMSRADTILTDAIAKHYRKYPYHPSTEISIVLAAPGNDTGICGCAGMIINK